MVIERFDKDFMIIEKFDKEYQEIISKYEEGKEVSEDVRNYAMKVLKEIIDNWKESNISSREKLGEEAGEIELKLFGMADLEVKKELDDIISQLMDIENSKAMINIDRFSLIKKVYKELRDL